MASSIRFFRWDNRRISSFTCNWKQEYKHRYILFTHVCYEVTKAWDQLRMKAQRAYSSLKLLLPR